MSKAQIFYDTLNQIGKEVIRHRIVHLSSSDEALRGNSIRVNNHDLINFGSCSYLGLEFDERLKQSAKQAVDDYGTQFSAARIYISSRHYEELESYTDKIFGGYSVVAPTTTLAHIATIPVIIKDEDAIILDHQAHNSMQNAVNLVKARGVYVEMIRHNNMEMLESRVKELRQKHRKIWYMADGIYSMFGDPSPVEDVYMLMEKYPELYYYVDDAHGMSCFGQHGRGYVLSRKPYHDKLIFVSSFAKAFATGGAVVVFKEKDMVLKLRNTGSPFLSSGPLQPASLGAAIASAKIHLSDEIYSLQEDLRENIKYTNLMLKKYCLPSISENNSPVFFVGVGLPAVGFSMVQRLIKEGFLTNIGVFPTVPMKNTGVRFTITKLHSFDQIEKMIRAMAFHYPIALEECGFTMEKVYKAFKMQSPQDRKLEENVNSLINQSLKLKLEHHQTILDVDKNEWDSLPGDRGAFDWEGLNFLESSFRENELPEDNWDFDYILVRDINGKVVLATFLTTAICKDDMLSPAEISMQIEEKRKTEKYYMCSKTIMCGSLLTEGNHLYLDRNSQYWKDAVKILLDKIAELQDQYKATVINLRDFSGNDPELDSFLTENGYFKMALPENAVVKNITWRSREEFVSRMASAKTRYFIKSEVFRHENKYEVEKVSNCSSAEIEQLYTLYLNIKNRNYLLNTFTLPYKLFQHMTLSKNWDIFTLKLKPEFDRRAIRKPVSVSFAYIGQKSYCGMIMGMDYDFQKEHNCYRQTLFQSVLRAKELGKEQVRMGFGTSFEKKRFGAEITIPYAYIQLKDNFTMEALGAMSSLRKNLSK